jgi:hypothetical protein
LGGDEGAALIESGREFMHSQGVKNTDRFAHLCGPLPLSDP